MDIVVTGRHCTINPELKELVHERIATVERLRDRVIRAEVDFTADDATKDPSHAISVQLTLRSRGPVVRARGEGERQDRGLRDGPRQAEGAAPQGGQSSQDPPRGYTTAPSRSPRPRSSSPRSRTRRRRTIEVAGLVVTGDGPLVVRVKEFDAEALTLAQALDEMELVGHDFFLYQDKESGRPSVVYRRKAYNYGVIHLNVS